MNRLLFVLDVCRYHALAVSGLVLFTMESVIRWIVSRVWVISQFLVLDGRRVLQILPAVLAVGASIALMLCANTKSATVIEDRYLQSARRALAAGDLPAAELWFRRLAHDREDHTAAQLGLALVAQRQKNLPRARQIMQRLASSDRRGPAAAHLWLAKDLLARGGTKTLEESEIIEKHLHQFLDQQPNNTDAAALLGTLYLQTERPRDAIPYLRAAFDADPRSGLYLGSAYLRAGKKDLARDPLQRASDAFRKPSLENPEAVQSRLRWAECRLLLEDFASAREILFKGFAHSEKLEYRLALINTLVAESDSLRQSEKPDLKRSLELLDAAMKLGPGNPYVLNRWAVIASSPGPEREQIKQALTELLVQGKASAGVHLILGSIAVYEGRHSQANQHFQLGLKQAPKMAGLLNNYAWSLTHSDPPDLNRALELANQAVESSPNEPEFLETRGQILAGLNRWDDAIADLEKALVILPERPELRETLAKAYSATGRDDIAEAHRARLRSAKQ